ncbi:unnamed protein product [Prorocentrum cordatum]|uniref:Phosphatidylinositol 3,4,5-trisphosphate 3-phosphatase and dual-specificity protein phosphatase PTEN n=1 Tax=Prorocentrum cordatum TaxID=2364126 RepID=A0ABN9XRU5_9DINO|nr:unnamed protein product [Polarella glacialis]
MLPAAAEDEESRGGTIAATASSTQGDASMRRLDSNDGTIPFCNRTSTTGRSNRNVGEHNVLTFLQDVICNPDLEDPEVRKRVGMPARRKRSSELAKRSTELMCLRSVVGQVVFSWPVQAVVFMVVMFDLVLTGISLGDAIDSAHPINDIGDYVIVSILAADVCLRWFAKGSEFVFPARECKLNLFEIILVPITILEVAWLKDLAEDVPLPILRALRPILRGVRLLRVLFRTAGKGQQYLTRLRHQVSGNRRRFVEDGFDLDLQYISPQIIVMSNPAVGRDAILHNPLPAVSRFLNERHGNSYLVLNVTQERRYPLGPFFGRYYQFPIAQDGVPTLDGLLTMVRHVDLWLKEDPRNVVAVHSKHNQGRSAVFVVALLLHRKLHRSASTALQSFENLRRERESGEGEPTQTLDSASQMRFLEYFAHACSRRSGLPRRSAKITRIQLTGLSNAHLVDLSCFKHPGEPQKSIAGVDSGELHKMMARADGAGGSSSEDRSPLQMRVVHAIEEGAMDSRRSGSAPLPGDPIFSSKQELLDPRKVVVRTMKNSETQEAVCRIWEIKDVDLSGDIRLELHLGGAETELDPGAVEHAAPTACGWCCRRRVKPPFKRKFSGMLFGCWLHTSLLEHDEVRDRRAGRKPGRRLEISLERFSLDKAAGAPSLRSLSTFLRLDLEFDVEHRVQLQDLDAELPELSLVTSNLGMSEAESLKWLTWVMERIWPKFKLGFEKMLKDGVASARPSLPVALQSLSVVRCSFGDGFPQLGPIHASSRNHVSSEDRDGLEVQLDIGLTYSTDADIIMQMGLLQFGICNISFTGTLNIRFSPLLDEIPVFSAMQMFFLNSPEIEIRFKHALEVANTSFVRQYIQTAIKQAIDNRLTVPHLLNINWADPLNDETVTWPTVMPSFVARLTVHAATGLRSSSTVLTRDPEAVARLSVGSRTVQTAAIRGPGPRWAETFDFVIYDARQHLEVEVFDVDFAGSCWPIGRVKGIQVEHLAAEGVAQGQWKTLGGETAGPDSRVHLSAAIFDLARDPSKLPARVLASQPQQQAVSVGLEAGETSGSPRKQQAGDLEADLLDDQLAVRAEEGALAGSDHNYDSEQNADFEPEPPGSVALLVCHILGGQLPRELGKPSEVEVSVSFGGAGSTERCQDPAEGSGGNLPEKTQKRIERLAQKGFAAGKIAEALGEDHADVVRCIRRASCNLSVQHKLCLHLQTSDFMNAHQVNVQIMKAKAVLAEGTFPLSIVLESSVGTHDGEVVCTSKMGVEVKLDVELRLFALVPRFEVDGAHSPGSLTAPPSPDEAMNRSGLTSAEVPRPNGTLRRAGPSAEASYAEADVPVGSRLEGEVSAV